MQVRTITPRLQRNLTIKHMHMQWVAREVSSVATVIEFDGKKYISTQTVSLMNLRLWCLVFHCSYFSHKQITRKLLQKGQKQTNSWSHNHKCIYYSLTNLLHTLSTDKLQPGASIVITVATQRPLYCLIGFLYENVYDIDVNTWSVIQQHVKITQWWKRLGGKKRKKQNKTKTFMFQKQQE